MHGFALIRVYEVSTISQNPMTKLYDRSTLLQLIKSFLERLLLYTSSIKHSVGVNFAASMY